MIEGLWTVRFLIPDGMVGDLNGGVAVIETGRLLGGDSGYFYVGDIAPLSPGSWFTKLTITRHDPSIESLFGDLDNFYLEGNVEAAGSDQIGRPILKAHFMRAAGPALEVEMRKVAELP